MYGTVATVAAQFDPQQWDPTAAGAAPDSATVTAMLTAAGATLDGEIAHLVDTPVTAPKLLAVCDSIACLRVQADVWDLLYPPTGTQDMKARRSAVWRAEANRLVGNIQSGATADATPLRDAAAAPGAPLGDSARSFGFTDGGLF